MRLSVLPTFLFLAAVVKAQGSQTALLDNINHLTSEANSLSSMAKGLRNINTLKQGYNVLDSLKALFEDFGPIIEGSPTEEYEGTGANEIAKAYESHVQAMQQLSSTFIGKRLVLDPFTSLVHSFHDRLDDVESSEDFLLERLQESVFDSTAEEEIKSNHDKLATSLRAAIETYKA